MNGNRSLFQSTGYGMLRKISRILSRYRRYSMYLSADLVLCDCLRACPQAFYAVKCHPNAMMMKTLAAMGAGFDCASRAGVLLTGPSPAHEARGCKIRTLQRPERSM